MTTPGSSRTFASPDGASASSASTAEQETAVADSGDTAIGRSTIRSVGFAVATLLGVALCVVVAYPLIFPVLWAIVLCVVARPLHARVERRIGHPTIAAALATAMVALPVALPFAFVAAELLLQVSEAVARLNEKELARLWQETLARHSQLEAIERRLDFKALLSAAAGGAARFLRGLLSWSVAAATGWLITIFVLFFFLRDRRRLLVALARWLPLSDEEMQEVLATAEDTIYATVWGTLGVAILQGMLGGLAFWWLGLPAPLLWGGVMATLSLLPVVGAALVWMPVAAYLALQGDWPSAILLATFGAVVIGLADNLLYPLIVKDRIRLHAVPVFVSIIGALIVFGASGVVLGPLLLAVTDTLMSQWRRRLGA